MKRRRNILDSPIDEVDFSILDVETTGLYPDSGDRVIEVGVVKVRGGAIVDSFNSLINPERPISPGAFYVNKISPQMVSGAPKFFEIADQLLEFVNNSVLAAYNSPFDMSFIGNEFRLAGVRLPEFIVIDVLKLARTLLPGIKSYKQGNVAAALSITTNTLHRALEDVIITSQIFSTISGILKAHGLNKLSDISNNNINLQLEQIRLEMVKDALSGERNLWIKYFSPHHFEISERVVTPHQIIQEGRISYLAAYCHHQKADRSFHLGRIFDIKII
jgi:DNA polymerase III epsilon subunit family exonuclease